MSPKISRGDLARIAKRHPAIDQDALPIDVPTSTRGGGEPVSQKSPKSIRFAKCPHHVSDGTGRNGGLTGLIALNRDQLVFREHTKRIGSVSVQCPGSGQPAPTSTTDDNDTN